MVVLQSLWDIIVLFAIVMAVAPWFGEYLGRVYMDRPAFGDVILAPIEWAIYRILGTSPRRRCARRST